MKNVRIGNDILFIWEVKYADGNLIDLTALKFTLYLITPTKRVQINDYTLQDNKLYWRFYGKDQEDLGEYSMTLVINQQKENMITIDAMGIFRLVSYVDANKLGLNNNQPVMITKDSITTTTPLLPVIPVIGKNGNWVINSEDTGMPSRGESWYELCVRTGRFEGTEEEFLNEKQQQIDEAKEAAQLAADKAEIATSTIEEAKAQIQNMKDTGAEMENLMEQVQTELEAVETKSQELDAAEALRVEAENGRVSAENVRVEKENDRISAEDERTSHESTREENEAVRIQNENSRIAAETERNNFESARKVSEEARVSSESTRQANEQARISAEEGRVAEEEKRADQEEVRQLAETTRDSQEAARQSHESDRENAESVRQSNEATRNSNEESRISEEKQRNLNEIARNIQEDQRKADEATRQNQESARVSAEESRVQAESLRVTAESNRVQAESERDAAEDERIERFNQMCDNEAIRENNEADRQAAEEARKTAEATRKSQEEARVAAETSRVQAENTRSEAEALRVESENERNTAEENRVNAEQSRVSVESSRVAAESERVANETARKNNEAARNSKEEERQTNEQARITSESSRVTAEASRVQTESDRVTEENKRVTAENERVEAENARVAAETSRNQTFNQLKTEVETATQKANSAATLANEKATLANTKAEEASTQAAYAKEQGDAVKAIFPDFQATKDSLDSLNDRVSLLEYYHDPSRYAVAAWNNDDLNPEAMEFQGNKAIVDDYKFMLIDTTDNARETTGWKELKRNNLLRYADGSFAPTVGITAAMYDECATNDLYTLAEDGVTYELLYAAGEYDAEGEWEYDKALIRLGNPVRTLYIQDAEGISYIAVEHKFRPWETTETKYTIGLGMDHDVYLIDNVIGKSGKAWQGLFLDPIMWDGIDTAPYKLAPTAISPSPVCTVGGKTRSFFYLYQGESNCQSSAGVDNVTSIFKEGRTYPCVNDMNQVNNMSFARKNNADTTVPYPFAEGGFHALNTYNVALEVLYGTRYIHGAAMFGTGISSNDACNSETTWKTNGGCRYRLKGVDTWSYAGWGTTIPYFTKSDLKTKTYASNVVNYEYPKEQCMESQMAFSYAMEAEIEPDTMFDFYGGQYWYQVVPNTSGVEKMNVRVYRIKTGIANMYNSNAEAVELEIECCLRMSLFGGMNGSGDFFVYWGGGYEQVGTCMADKTPNYNNPMKLYLEPDQKKWLRETAITANNLGTFSFESAYKLMGESVNLGNNWAKSRMPYTGWKTANGGSAANGMCFYSWDHGYWSATLKQRVRVAARFRGHATHGACSRRNLYAYHAASHAYRFAGGSASVLIDAISTQ